MIDLFVHTDSGYRLSLQGPGRGSCREIVERLGFEDQASQTLASVLLRSLADPDLVTACRENLLWMINLKHGFHLTEWDHRAVILARDIAEG